MDPREGKKCCYQLELWRNKPTLSFPMENVKQLISCQSNCTGRCCEQLCYGYNTAVLSYLPQLLI